MENQKRHSRKLLSILLVLCMVLTIVPITAFAGVTDVTGGGTSTSYQHGNTNVTSPKTGDNSNLALWFAVLFISCGGVIGVTVYSRRRKLNKR